MKLIAIDPGNEQSAYVVLDDETPVEFGKIHNQDLRDRVRQLSAQNTPDHLAIETLNPRGMPVSIESMQTQFWAGRFVEAWHLSFTQIDRKDVKMALCGQSKAKDSNIRQALIDRYGGQEKAIGGKKCKECKGTGNMGTRKQPFQCWTCGGNGHSPKGPLNGFAGDCWQALACGLTYLDSHQPVEA